MCTDPSLDDEKYYQALELYTLVRHVTENLCQKYEDGTASEEEVKTLMRAMSLRDDIETWRRDTPDVVVTTQDREDVEKIIGNIFQGPPEWVRGSIPDDNFVSFSSLPKDKQENCRRDSCERTTISFYNGNRCFVGILFYYDAPLAAAGLRIYLFKHEGQWKVCEAYLWIS